MSEFTALKQLLTEVLAIEAGDFTPETPLLGAIPELDSMAIMTLLLAIEGRFAISVEGADLSADAFATLGSLMGFIDQYRAG